jgi:hypothetical protein
MGAKAFLVGALVLTAGCVPVPEDAAGLAQVGTTIVDGPFKTLDAGASQLDSLHFSVRAYGPELAKQISASAEESYARIMVDTNLFSFMPRGLYQIVVYADQDEYRRKTGQPEWSGGATVGNAIYTFRSPSLDRTLAHEMTHLIFFEYMGKVNIDHRWVNEGLAVYEEGRAGRGGSYDAFAQVRSAMVNQPIPMDQMISLAPATERQYVVSVWYCEAETLVRYLIERGGRIGFAQFLAQLKDGQNFDHAIAAAFPGSWRGLDDFVSAWRRSLN